jgi:hypothetical protein
MGQLTFQATLGGAVNLIGPNTAATTNLTLPAADGTSGQALTTNGSGTLAFANIPLASAVSGTLPIANGGTGTTSTTFANLTTNVTGTLPIANGGTNSTATATAGGIGYGTGTAHAYTAAGTSGQVLTSAGAGAPTWASPSSALVYISQVVASSSSTVSFTGLTAYDNYMIIWSKVYPDTASSILFTMFTSTNNGSSYATTNYKYGMPYVGSNGTGVAGIASSTNSTYINICPDNMNSARPESQISGQVILNLKNSTSVDFSAWGQIAMVNDSFNLYAGAFSAYRTETSQVNAVRFKFTSGNMTTGTFRLYGIVNS